MVQATSEIDCTRHSASAFSDTELQEQGGKLEEVIIAHLFLLPFIPPIPPLFFFG